MIGSTSAAVLTFLPPATALCVKFLKLIIIVGLNNKLYVSKDILSILKYKKINTIKNIFNIFK